MTIAVHRLITWIAGSIVVTLFFLMLSVSITKTNRIEEEVLILRSDVNVCIAERLGRGDLSSD